MQKNARNQRRSRMKTERRRIPYEANLDRYEYVINLAHNLRRSRKYVLDQAVDCLRHVMAQTPRSRYRKHERPLTPLEFEYSDALLHFLRKKPGDRKLQAILAAILDIKPPPQ